VTDSSETVLRQFCNEFATQSSSVTKEDKSADDDDQRRPSHAVYHVIDRVHLLDNDPRWIDRIVETLERVGEAARAPSVGELLHLSLVVFELLETDAIRTLQTTHSTQRHFHSMHANPIIHCLICRPVITLLCGRPNRPQYGHCPSVCLSVP